MNVSNLNESVLNASDPNTSALTLRCLRIGVLAALVLAAALPPLGCGGGQEETQLPGAGEGPPPAGAPNTAPLAATPTAPRPPDLVARQDWLVEHIPAEPAHLNPVISSDAYASRLFVLIFNRLLARDLTTLEFEPEVARDWDVSDDHLTYTFYLRDDVVFSDGEPLTAHDVAFTFNRIKDPTVDAPFLRNYYESVERAEVVDDYTVRFHCTKPYYRHLVMLASFEIMPEHVYSEGDFNNHPNNRNPVGSGAYVVTEWTTGDQIRLERNPNYWGGEVDPAYYAVRVRDVITDDTASFEALLSGRLDTGTVRAEDWVRRATSARFTEQYDKYEYFEPRYSYIGYNMRRPIFQDKRLRQALTMLLDRDSIRENLLHGLARTVTGNFMPGTGPHNDAIEPWSFDPERAQALLSEAGWTDSDGDGLRDKDGQTLRFEALFVSQSTTAEQIATVWQEELQRAGIELNIRQLEWASLLERVKSHNFDTIFMGWSMPPDPDPYQVWHSSQTGANGSNHVGFENEEADRIIEEARVTFDEEKRNALYRRFHEIVHEEQPYTFLFAPKTLLAVAKRVEGVNVYTYGVRPIEWYTPVGMAKY